MTIAMHFKQTTLSIKMYRPTLLSLFVIFLCFRALLSLEVSQNDSDKIAHKLLFESYETCKHLVSEDDYQVMIDGSYVDNEETRAYVVCAFKFHKWLVNGNLDADKIYNDAVELMSQPLSPPEKIAAKIIFNICRAESEKEVNESGRIHAFGHCMGDRCLSYS